MAMIAVSDVLPPPWGSIPRWMTPGGLAQTNNGRCLRAITFFLASRNERPIVSPRISWANRSILPNRGLLVSRGSFDSNSAILTNKHTKSKPIQTLLFVDRPDVIVFAFRFPGGAFEMRAFVSNALVCARLARAVANDMEHGFAIRPFEFAETRHPVLVSVGARQYNHR